MWLLIPLWVLLGSGIAWAALAVWIDGPSSQVVAGALSLGVVGVFVGAAAFVRPVAYGLGVGLAVFGAVLLWWLQLEPRNDRDWLPDVARLPSAIVDGDRLTVRNVRNFEYRSETDYTERWEERTYDLRDVRGIDFFLVYWGSPNIAHTIVSFDFGADRYLAFSIETRKERGEEYSAIRGFFRQFELYYVIADERDVVGLRTHERGEDVYLYRLNVTPERARELLLDYLGEVNQLADSPHWYNAVTHNCTTQIQHHVDNIAPDSRWDWRILVNGYIDELGYETGRLDTTLPFAELRERSYINPRARAEPVGPDFSERIREGLPNPRTATSHGADRTGAEMER